MSQPKVASAAVLAAINWATIDDIATAMLAGGETREAMIQVAAGLPAVAGDAEPARIRVVEAAVKARVFRRLADNRVAFESPLGDDTGPPYVVVIKWQYDTDGDQQTDEWTTSLVARTKADADAVAAAIEAHAETMGPMFAWRISAGHHAAPETSVYYTHGDMRFRSPSEAPADLAFEVEAWAWCHYDGLLSDEFKAALTEERKKLYRSYAYNEGWPERGPDDEDFDDLDDDDDLEEAERLLRLEDDEDDEDS